MSLVGLAEVNSVSRGECVEVEFQMVGRWSHRITGLKRSGEGASATDCLA